MLGTGAALGGAGATLRSGITPEDTRKLQGFADVSFTDYGGSEAGLLQSVKDYAQRGHEAATAKLFGATSTDVMRALRSNPVADFIGQGWVEEGNEASAPHYERFMESPLNAYLRRNEEISYPLFDPSARGGVQSKAQALVKAPAGRRSYHDELAQEFGRALPPGFLYHDYTTRLAAALKELGQTESEVPVGGEFDARLRKLDPELADVKRTVDLHSGIANRQENPTSQYAMTVINPLLNIRKWGPWVGGGLALGGAGWLLHRYLAKQKREREEAEARSRAGEVAEIGESRGDLRKAAQFFDSALDTLSSTFDKQASPYSAAFRLGFVETLAHFSQ
jgi:hypothetical protein